MRTSTRRLRRARSLIMGINLKSQLRSDRKKSPLGSINGGNGSLTTRGKSRRTWAINFLRLPDAHVPPKIYHDTFGWRYPAPSRATARRTTSPKYLRLIQRKSFSNRFSSVSFRINFGMAREPNFPRSRSMFIEQRLLTATTWSIRTRNCEKTVEKVHREEEGSINLRYVRLNTRFSRFATFCRGRIGKRQTSRRSR